MAKKSDVLQGTEQEFLRAFRQLCTARSPWEVWADLMSMIACSISNAVDRTPGHFERREKEYMACLERMGMAEIPARLLGIIVMALENEPEQDFLGKMFMDLELGNHWKGQFFTPYIICRMMSEITCGELDRQIAEQGYISVCDPACGAGATLIAAANSMKGGKYNFQNHVLFVGQDIDRVVGLMCYIQLSLLGCAGYVCIGNTLTNPLTGDVLFPQEGEGQELWFTPMFQSEVWAMRRMFHMAGRLCKAGGGRKQEEPKRKKRFCVFFKGDDSVKRKESYENKPEREGALLQEMPKEKPHSPEEAKERAKEKLGKELEKTENKSFSKSVIDHLIRRCEEDAGFAEDVLQGHKTWQKCQDYIDALANEQAKKERANRMFWVDNDVVYEWAEDYYRRDDKAEEAEKARKAAEAEEKRKAAAAKAEEAAKIAGEKAREVETAEQQKPIKPTVMEGQLDLFLMMEE